MCPFHCPLQPVPVFGIMAVQTPPVLLVMPEDDLRVEGQSPTIRIGRNHPVTVGAGIDAGRKGWRRDFQLFLRLRRRGELRLVGDSLGGFLVGAPTPR